MTSIITFLVQTVLTIFDAITFFLPKVSELPLGMDGALTFVVGNIKGFVTAFPFAQMPWNLFLLGITIEFLLFSWHWAQWFIKLVRG